MLWHSAHEITVAGQLAAIGIADIYERAFGHRPARVTVFDSDRVLVAVLTDVFDRMEVALVERGYLGVVRRYRREIRESLAPSICRTLGELYECDVDSMAGDVGSDGVACLTFTKNAASATEAPPAPS